MNNLVDINKKIYIKDMYNLIDKCIINIKKIDNKYNFIVIKDKKNVGFYYLEKYYDEDKPRVISPSYFAIADQLQISNRTLRYAKEVLEDLCLISSETYIYRGSDTEFRKFTCFTYFSDYSHKEIVSYLRNSKYIDYTRCTSDK